MAIKVSDLYGTGKQERINLPSRSRSATVVKNEFGISKDDFRKSLEAHKKDGSIPSEFQDAFGKALQDGRLVQEFLKSGGSSLGNLFAAYLNKEASNGEQSKTLLGASSGLAEYITDKFKPNSQENLLLQYLIQVTNDPEKKEISTALARELQDNQRGLDLYSKQLNRVRTSSDPLVKVLFHLAANKGLTEAVRQTKEDALNGVSSRYTQGLNSDLLKSIAGISKNVNTASYLGADGSLVIGYKADGKTPISIPSIEVTEGMEERSGSRLVKGDSLNFREFFEDLQALSAKLNDAEGNIDSGAAQELKDHVTKGLNTIYQHYLEKHEATKDPKEKSDTLAELKSVANTLKGRGTLPSFITDAIQTALSLEGPSQSLVGQISSGIAKDQSKSLLETFKSEDLGDNSEVRSKIPALNSLVSSDKKVQIIDPDTLNHSYLELTANDISELTTEDAKKARAYNGITTVETAYSAYNESYEKEVAKTYDQITSELTGDKQSSNKLIAQNKRDFTKALSAANFDTDKAIKDFFTEQLTALGSKVNSTNRETVETALRKLIESLAGKTGDKKWYDKKEQDTVRTAAKALTTNIVNGSALNADELITALIANTDVGSIEDLKSRLAGNHGKAKLTEAFNQFRAPAAETDSLSKVIDLSKIESLFDGSSSRAKTLQRLLERESIESGQSGQKFKDIKDNPGISSEIASMIFAKSEDGSSVNDEKLVGLLGLISKVDTSERLNLIEAIVSELYSGPESEKEDAKVLLSEKIQTFIDADTKIGETEADLKNRISKEFSKVLDKEGDTDHRQAVFARLSELVGQGYLSKDQAKSIRGIYSAPADGKEFTSPEHKQEILKALTEAVTLPKEPTKLSWKEYFGKYVTDSKARARFFARQLNTIRDEKSAIEGHMLGNFLGLFSRSGNKPKVREEATSIISDIEAKIDASDKPLAELKKDYANDPDKMTIFNKIFGETFNPLNIKVSRYEDEPSILERALSFLYGIASHAGLVTSPKSTTDKASNS